MKGLKGFRERKLCGVGWFGWTVKKVTSLMVGLSARGDGVGAWVNCFLVTRFYLFY